MGCREQTAAQAGNALLRVPSTGLRVPERLIRSWLWKSLCTALFGYASAVLCLPANAAGNAPNVLVLYSNSRLLPANIETDRALRETIVDSPAGPVTMFDEFLDAPNFGPEAFLHAASYLRDKYASRVPAVIVAVGSGALGFLLENRAQLFPRTPIVHVAVPHAFVRSVSPLPFDVLGVPAEFDFLGTVDLALRLHPKARRLVVVTGAAETDRQWKEAFEPKVSGLRQRLKVEFFSGLATQELRQRLSELTRDDVVFTPGYFQDGSGRPFTPRESIDAMTAASTAPIYAPFSTFVGRGIVGGSMWTFEGVARQAGAVVNELLAGTPAESIHLPDRVPWTVQIDWRQLDRWGIDQTALPRDAVINFESPSFLAAHKIAVFIAALAFLLETTLISVLLLERQRRRKAELALQKQRSELAHASRLAIAGELTAAIAHQMNQPLGAILTNTNAAELILNAVEPPKEMLREIIADIRRDDLRASDVIRRLRTLIVNHDFEQQPFDLNEAVSDAESILRVEARQRRVTLDIHRTPAPVTIVGDRIQIQQVLINLLLNAMDAVATLPDSQRAVSVSVETVGDSGRIDVRDEGAGIAPQDLQKVFDSFFSTKGTMGLGLSIARNLVHAHGGHIWAENGPSNMGATFHIELPTAQMEQGLQAVDS
jgi:signal transduction histidine kinase